MASYWRVSPKFWSDPKVLAWDDDTRYLALYVLTCAHRTTEGLFRLPPHYILGDLGWSRERLERPFAQLLTDGFISHDSHTHVVLIRKALEYQSPENPNQVKAAIRQLEDLPPSPRLTCEFKRLAERFCERLADALPEGFGEPPTPSPTPTPSPEPLSPSEPSSLALVHAVHVPTTDPVQAVFDAWVEATDKRRSVLDANRRNLIRKALDRYPFDDVIDAVRGWRRSPWHCGKNPGRKVYNDLGLLLRNADKIEGFRDMERVPPGAAIPKRLLDLVAWSSEETG